MKINERDELDELMNSALATYADAEPLTGLEQRVLNRSRLVSARARRWVPALLAVTVGCCLLAIVILRPRPVLAPPAVVVNQVRYKTPVKTSIVEQQPVVETKRVPTPKRHGVTMVPKVTPEERALLELVVSHSTEAEDAFADLRIRGNKVIVIQPIQVAPLSTEELF